MEASELIESNTSLARVADSHFQPVAPRLGCLSVTAVQPY